MDFAYYMFIVALVLLANIGKLEQAISNIDLRKKPQKNEDNIYAHHVVMEMGEILSRPPTDRYPDMETNQAKVKLYYQRLKDSPVEIGNVEPAKNEKVKPILVSVK